MDEDRNPQGFKYVDPERPNKGVYSPASPDLEKDEPKSKAKAKDDSKEDK